MLEKNFIFQSRTLGANNPVALWQTESLYKVKNGHVNLYIIFPQMGASSSRIYVTSFFEGEVFCNIKQLCGIAFLAVAQDQTNLEEINEKHFLQQIISDPLSYETIEWLRKLQYYCEKVSKICSYSLGSKEIDSEFLQHLHEHFLKWAHDFYQNNQEQDTLLLKNKNIVNEQFYENALLEFSEVMHSWKHLEPSHKKFTLTKGKNSLIQTLCAAMEQLAKVQKIEFIFPKKFSVQLADSSKLENNVKRAIEEICRLSKIRYRKITLRSGWYRDASYPLLAFEKPKSKNEEAVPLLLIQDNKRYHAVSFNRGFSGKITEKTASYLEDYAFVFYRPFSDQTLTAKTIFSWIAKDLKSDAKTALVNGVLGAIVALAIPLVMARLFDYVIPNAEINLLVIFCVIMLSVAFANAIFSFVQSVAILRMENKANINLNTALWDRLLRLPVHFFRSYSVADLADRASAVSRIHQIISNAALTMVFTFLSVIANFLLLFHYHENLAASAVFILILTFLFYSVNLKITLHWLRKQMPQEGKISSTVFQILDGLSKIKVAAAEKRAFAVWSKQYSELIKILQKIRHIQITVKTYNSALLVLGNWLIYWVANSYIHFNASLTLGKFVAFSAAFTMFVKGGITLCDPLFELLKVIPLWQRAQPILQELPEISASKATPRELQGKIEVDHVSFSYNSSDQLALDDVSFLIQPGEFVALVGTSGSGKSTMLRILLGFESPDKGSVYFDDQDLNHIDVSAIRRNVGVVLQNGRLLSGDIFTNIVGSLPLSMEDAWRAAKWAGLEEDIQAMPMGMHTMVGEASSTLSGGQRQRIMIARALVRHPKILFFDEATSALDNVTQKTVQDSLDSLGITRLVIAHRLSTIRNADRIFVFSKGKIVQQGHYETLIKQDGIFQDLISRQIS